MVVIPKHLGAKKQPNNWFYDWNSRTYTTQKKLGIFDSRVKFMENDSDIISWK